VIKELDNSKHKIDISSINTKEHVYYKDTYNTLKIEEHNLSTDGVKLK
jgi:hypothetical protein